jgi:arsenical pump membrane protein
MDFAAREPFLVCTITGATIVGFLFRPMRLPVAVWACLGALALILLHLISWEHTVLAVSKGTDVYLFLTGMMLLAEFARWKGVFDWLAAWAVRAANKSAIILVALKDRQAPPEHSGLRKLVWRWSAVGLFFVEI